MSQAEALSRLVRYWERLTPADVERLHEVYAGDAFFRDPFNEVRGVEAIKGVFRKQPVFIRNLTPVEIGEANKVNASDLRDPAKRRRRGYLPCEIASVGFRS